MNDREKRHWDLLKDLRERLKKINSKVDSTRKVLKRIRQTICDNIYLLGDYCAKHLCFDDFNYSFAFRIIENIEKDQTIYDAIAKELSLYLESKDYLLNNINNICKKLGIEYVY